MSPNIPDGYKIHSYCARTVRNSTMCTMFDSTSVSVYNAYSAAVSQTVYCDYVYIKELNN